MAKDLVVVVDHPFARAILTTLRDRRTDQINFRKGLVRLGRIIGMEMTKHLDTERVYVETPLGVTAEGVRIPDMDYIVIVNILRAAMPMVEGLIKIFPSARQGIVSARRVEEKGMASSYEFDVEIHYVKIPRIYERDTVIIVDPMFATGSTMVAVVNRVISGANPKRLFFATAISTPIAIERLRRYLDSKDLTNRSKLFTVAIDPEINEKGYIVPGLGDAGDRAFGHG
ncbi:MAG: uracil phosphoribosyltransferase [Desulfurococcales archaeon]|nr:uracil phosphoribosyltransferase [Desulfurococcales archaeon]